MPKIVIIFLSTLILFNLAFAKEINLECKGYKQYLTWNATNWIYYKNNFEIFYDDSYQDKFIFRRIHFCDDEGEFEDKVKIGKPFINYECNAINYDPNHIPAKTYALFQLDRQTGKYYWEIFMTSKRNKTESFRIKGYGICKYI